MDIDRALHILDNSPDINQIAGIVYKMLIEMRTDIDYTGDRVLALEAQVKGLKEVTDESVSIDFLDKVLDGLHCRCTNCLEYENFTYASTCDICKRYICHSCQDEFGHNYPDSGFHTLCENHAIEAGTISLEELVAYLLANGWIRHQGTNKKVWVFTAPDKYEADRPIRVILPINDRYVDTYKKIENTIELLANLDNDPQDKVRRQIKKGTHK